MAITPEIDEQLRTLAADTATAPEWETNIENLRAVLNLGANIEERLELLGRYHAHLVEALEQQPEMVAKFGQYWRGEDNVVTERYSKWSSVQVVECDGPSDCWRKTREIARREVSSEKTGLDHFITKYGDDPKTPLVDALRVAIDDMRAGVEQIEGTDDEGKRVLVWYAMTREAPWRFAWSFMRP